MTILELKDWLDKYPDTAQIHASVVARNGRGGTFEEQLLFDGSHHDERTNTVYMTFGFEIGWLNAHPEFQPPAEPEAGRPYEELEADILTILSGLLDRSVDRDTTFESLRLTGEQLDDILRVTQGIRIDRTTDYAPETVEQILACKTLGGLIDYCIDGPKPLEQTKNPTTERRKEILDALVWPLDDPPQITEETTFQELNLDSMGILSLMGAAQVLHEDGKTSYEPPNTATLLSCKTFGGLIDYLIDGKEASY